MIYYEYKCDNCGDTFSRMLPMDERDKPTLKGCEKCEQLSIYRVLGCGSFTVPEGGCGNAANGYSSYVGDAEIFKAKSKKEREQLKKEYKVK